MKAQVTIIGWLFVLTVGLSAQFELERVGRELPAIREDLKKANQSKVFFHQGYWRGVLRPLSSTSWFLYHYENGAWKQDISLGVTGEDQPDVHVDPDRNKVYILFSSNSQFVRLTISPTVTAIDTGFPKTLVMNTASNDPACLVKALDGDLFIFYVTTDSLRMLYSSNDGQSWTPNRGIRQSSTALTDAVAFSPGGQNRVGVFVGEGSGSKRFRFFTLHDTAAASVPGNWVEETLPGNFSADDHVNIIRDFDHNLYVLAKLAENLPNGTVFKLLKRSTGGTWSSYDVLAGFTGTTSRPALALDETNKQLYALATVGDLIRYAPVPKDNLTAIQTTDWKLALKNKNDLFNNVSTSYQPLTGGTGLMLVAENKTEFKSWFNLLELPYSADTPLIISEVNSADTSQTGSASFIELYNFSRNSISLGDYRVKYYDNGDNTVTESIKLSGTLAPLGYVVISNDSARFHNAYGYPPDFVDAGFPFDGGEDAIMLFDDNTIVDGFNNGPDRKVKWSVNQNFQRTGYPNDGRNLFLAYRNSAAPQPGTPGGANAFPVLKNSLITGIANGAPDFANRPEILHLHPAYPNPFNPVTTVRFELGEPARVQVDIFNIAGQRIRRLLDAHLFAGTHTLTWDGRNSAAAGIYFLQVRTARVNQTRKLILAK